MGFVDACIRFAAKKESVEELGFTGFRALSTVKAETPGDLRAANENSLLESSNIEVLRQACKIGRVKFFFLNSFQPDVGLLRDAAEHRKAFMFPISLLLESRGVQRAMLMGKMRFLLQLCIKFKAQYILCSGAKDEYQLKSPEEMTAIGETLGLSHDQAQWAIREAPAEFIV